MENKLGLVHIYTGDGKGKTTASLGTALRSISHGMNVCMIQFLKGGTYTGEYIASQGLLPRFTLRSFGKNCTYSEKRATGEFECLNCRDCFLTREECIEECRQAMNYAEEVLKSGQFNLVILDELNVAVSLGYVSSAAVLKLLKEKQKKVEVIITGRGAPKELIDAADYVTEMKKIKHPMDSGVKGRFGIEY